MEKDDQILLDELKGGNISAYALLFKKYYKLLSVKAYFMIEDEMDAEDLVQNLFVSIWQKQNYLFINTSIKAYLLRALHNRCLIYLEQKKRTEKKLENYKLNIETDDIQDHNAREDYEAGLSLIFNELPVQRQKAFKLVYLEEKRYKEAAEEMGISVNSIKTHLKLAVKTLQQKLNKYKP
ncbi:RNA polymerase sigma factor [Pedobacter metabolipauper]|uniref:RNA polymerase sigma-70 factor (ECF subfamily) n=1 Tax=Pedobacter metabolipauper TaxID=425513 RepID=A0A4R6T242_9SPHI|nr:sigma-70 family RNA polymerase sigma factor [Pedobacter metabolipauper]TDQ11590.1 RNA polymerase sigma-70 factor (ECF subfamily) [Pedobacter metabolipauper]